MSDAKAVADRLVKAKRLNALLTPPKDLRKSLATQDAMTSMLGFRTISIKELDPETKNVLRDSVAKDTTDANAMPYSVRPSASGDSSRSRMPARRSER